MSGGDADPPPVVVARAAISGASQAGELPGRRKHGALRSPWKPLLEQLEPDGHTHLVVTWPAPRNTIGRALTSPLIHLGLYASVQRAKRAASRCGLRLDGEPSLTPFERRFRIVGVECETPDTAH
jgi:hypothetical protein